ncbi:uncharacterized protein LOC131952940 [Physella acuta]|uniref:uncharacterized protein LOC131952940 n=1 Tax=Physella acuta TaxID=109671 RepID=UPI0027DE9F51|nr:uncharacterized protein LOC131952940 [Physella acuta]
MMEADKQTTCQTGAPGTEQDATKPPYKPPERTMLQSLRHEIYIEVLIPLYIYARFFVTLVILAAFSGWHMHVTLEHFEVYELFCRKDLSLRRAIWTSLPAVLTICANMFILLQCVRRKIRFLPSDPLTPEELRKLSAPRDKRKKDKNLKDRPVFTFDLDDVICRYAMKKLPEEIDYDERYMLDLSDKESYTCDVDWSALTIEHKVTKFSPKVKDGTVIDPHRGDVAAGSQWVTLLSRYYDNQTDCKQSHAFRGSRDTTSWVDVDLEQCYTVNKKVSAMLNLPPNLKVGNDNTLNLNKVRGEVFQKAHTWEINTQVEVEPSSRAHAQLLAKQECSVYDFEIRTTFSNRKGLIPVWVIGHDEHELAFDMYIEHLHEAFRLVEEGGVLKPEEKACVRMTVEKWVDQDGDEHSATFPQIITRGSCVCVSWTDQTVDIKTSPLSMDESTGDGDHNMINTPAGRTEEDPGVNSFVVVG